MTIQAVTSPLARDISKSARLEKTCGEFEAVFLSMIWKEMQKSAGTDLGGWSTFAEQAMGQYWAKGGGIGLAKVIYKQMEKHL